MPNPVARIARSVLTQSFEPRLRDFGPARERMSPSQSLEARCEAVLGRVIQRVRPVDETSNSQLQSEQAVMWRRWHNPPSQLCELSLGLQQLFNAPTSHSEEARTNLSQTQMALKDRRHRQGVRSESAGTIHVFQLTDAVLDLLGPMQLHDGKKQTYVVELQQAFLVIYPDGSGHVALAIDWCPNDGSNLELVEDLGRRLFVARHSRWHGARGKTTGWSFVPSESLAWALSGTPILRACEGRPVSFDSFADWLLQDHAAIKGSLPELVLSNSRYVRLRTAVVLGPRPSDQDNDTTQNGVWTVSPDPEWLNQACWILRRGVTDQYALGQDVDVIDRVIRPRANRVIGLSREGAASISWHLPDSDVAFEDGKWPGLFTATDRRQGTSLGLYTLLDLHLRQESVTAQRLGLRIARCVETMLESRSLTEAAGPLRNTRGAVDSMTLSLTFPDCGGISEYANYWREYRAILGIETDLQELRHEVQGLDGRLHLIEDRRRAKQAQLLTHVVGLIGALAVPSTIAAGYVAVTNKGWFWWSHAATLAVLAIVLIGYSRRHRHAADD